MHELSHRAALLILVVAGILTVSPLLGSGANYSNEAWAVVQHRQFMLGLLGAGLVLSAFVPALRLAAIGGAILSKTAFLVISLDAAFTRAQWLDAGLLGLLVLAAVVLAREAQQQARWDRRPLLLPEA
ncbi:MAG: hypothetical protein HYX47_11855 [Burkholderiales bacterium]|nr:hypothetical protein [Burkholderiales bacterium]